MTVSTEQRFDGKSLVDRIAKVALPFELFQPALTALRDANTVRDNVHQIGAPSTLSVRRVWHDNRNLLPSRIRWSIYVGIQLQGGNNKRIETRRFDWSKQCRPDRYIGGNQDASTSGQHIL
jgi:hypothetical protein